VVLDGIDVLLGVLGDPVLIRRELFRLREWLLESKLTAIITAKADPAHQGLAPDYDVLQFLADCVVCFNHRLSDSTAVRTLRVAKLRGSAHSANEFPFAISSSGIEVASGTSREIDHRVLSEKIETGVSRLDMMLGGGYFRGSSVLISGVPGTAKTTLAAAFAEAACRRGERTLFVSFDEAPNQISDTGPGMPPEVLRRLFTPFFTTKPIGVGTGLGLSICHRLVTSFGGQISVDSQPGNGTVFRIFLPQAESEDATDETPVAAPRAARRGRVLVVDDEKAIGQTVRRTLEPEHEVTALTSARDALERIEAGERFDVILCDLMMPQVTGMDLHAAMLQAAADQAARIIFLTGGAFTPAARAFVDKTTNLWIEKPFDVRQLRALVNDKIR
jgi:KaiC/GvpD/RAD55 family RecA-like ATPase